MKARTWLKGITIALCAATFTIACVACVPLDPNPNDDTTNKEETVEYNVTFDLNGGEAAEGVSYAARKVKDGVKVTLPEAPTPAEGKVFRAWKIGDSETYGDPEDQVEIKADTTITAVYDPIRLNIKYYDYDGTVFKTDTVDYGSAYTITTEKPENKYSAFDSWVAEDIEAVKSETSIYGKWAYMQTAEEFFLFTETENGEAYTVAESDAVVNGEVSLDEAGGYLFLPIVHAGKPVVGITAGTDNESAAFTNIDATTVFIPDAYTEVADYAFANNATITTVRYGETEGTLFADNALTKIGNYAFGYAANLATVFTVTDKTINIPNTVTEIGDYAFAFKGKITKSLVPTMDDTLSPTKALTFASNSVLTKIGESAFSFAGFGQVMDEDDNMIGATITFPASVEEIGAKAFIGARYVYTVAFEGNSRCKTIADEAFATSTEATGNYPGFMKNVTIPKSVTTIGYRGFFRQNLASWIFEKGGTENLTMGNQVFQHQGNDAPTLTSIEFPARLVSIGGSDNSFNLCDELTTITFENTQENPSRLTTIGNNCFKDNVKLQAITIPKSVTSIGDSAFSGSTMLASITFEKGGTETLTIGNLAFQGTALSSSVKNSPLTSVEIPARTTSIGRAAFANRYLLSSITFEATSAGQEEVPLTLANGALSGYTTDGAISSTSTAINYIPVTSLTIPKRTVSIGKYAFQGLYALTSLTFEAGIKAAAIQDNAAFLDVNLQTVSIPEGITSIGACAFGTNNKGTYKFNVISGTEGSLKVTSTTVTATNTALTTFSLPSTLEEIGAGAFFDYAALATLTFADKAETAASSEAKLEIAEDNFGFYSTHHPTAELDVTLGTNVKSVGDAFCQNSKLKSVTIKEGVQSIGKNAFSTKEEESAIKEVTLPASLTSMDATAFVAPQFATFKVEGGNTVYESTSSDNGILYKKAPAEGGNRTFVAIPRANTETTFEFTNVFIGENAFLNNIHITTVTLGANVTLGVSAFKGCTELQTLTINAQPTYLADATNEGAFEGCTSLDTVKLADSVTKLGFEMFRKCTNLISLDLSHITELGVNCFAGCTKFTGSSNGWSAQFTTLPDSNSTSSQDGTKLGVFSETNISTFDFTHFTYIGALAFYKIKLTEITLNAGTEVSYGAFYSCASLSSVTVIGNGTLKGVVNYGDKTMLENTISAYAFNATIISEFDLSKYQKIGTAAFTSTQLSTVNLSGINELGGNAFEKCKQLTEVTIPAAVTTIGAATFQNCTVLTKITLEGTTVKSLANTSAIPSSNKTLIIIVADDLVDDYRAATNWSNKAIANKIVGTSTVQVSFASEGAGDASVTLPEAVTVHKNEFYTLPAAPTATGLAEGVTFAGWKVGDGTELKAAGEQVEITAATTITAVYKKKTTVTFSWGEDVTVTEPAQVPTAQKVEKGGKVIDPNVTPVCEGKTFKGWKKQGAEDTELWDFASDTVPEEGDTLELVAVWEAAAPAE